MKRDEQKRVLARASKLFRTQRYHVRARFQGSIDLVCPCCGFISKYRMARMQYFIRCSDCDAGYVIKLTLMLMPGGGRRAIPPDFIIPDEKGERSLQEAFPTGDMEHWRTGGCTHEMVVVKEERG